MAALALASIVLAPPARASEMQWQGTLSLEFLALPAIAFEGAGVATLNAAGAEDHLTTLRLAGGITGAAIVPVTDPEVTATLTGIQVTVAIGTGTLRPFGASAPSGEPQLTQRVLPVHGLTRLCLLLACAAGLDLPLTEASGARGVGIGGLITAGGGGPIRLSLEGAPWTLRTATLSVETSAGGHVELTTRGWLHGVSSFSTSTAKTGGALSLVTPVRITSLPGRHLGAFARLSLRFVPEPGRLLLLGAGILGLVVIGRAHLRPGE